MNRRRAALAMLAGIASVRFSVPRAAAQQTGRVYRIGYLSTPTRQSVERALNAFLAKLRELGLVEGQNLIIEYRWAEGNVERLPELAAELVRLKVELIVAPAASAALAAQKATTSIPIVMIFPIDPVRSGLVKSLRRPEGNITGTTSAPGNEIMGKQLQILKDAIPSTSRVAILWNSSVVESVVQVKEAEAVAPSMRIRLQSVPARGPDDFESAFAAMAQQRAQALLVSNDSTFLVHRTRIAELALKARLPTMCSFREYVEAGSFMAYAVNMADFIGRAAVYVDRILKGAKPGDLPVEQPTKFELVINLKTAKALGVALAPSLLQRADEVIE